MGDGALLLFPVVITEEEGGKGMRESGFGAAAS